MQRLETFAWWPELLLEKDEMSLRELAAQFGVTPGAISAAFKRTGISRLHARPGPRVHRKKTVSPPGDLTIRAGSKDSVIAQYANQLGVVPDSEVARLAGVSVRTVASFRARHQVAGYHSRGPSKLMGPGTRWAYRMTCANEAPDVVVVARTLMEACERVSLRFPNWRLTGAVEVGPILEE